MHKSRSESEFEDLAYEPMPDPDSLPSAAGNRRSLGAAQSAAGGGWSNWIWGKLWGEE